jgi:glycosyltransferase involved in cell wall biosynthesis
MEQPSKVLITGGHEVGGLESFARALQAGFEARGIHGEVIPPRCIFKRPRELRNPRVLKILSTTAVFAAPFARRSICIAHGIPRSDFLGQGWKTVAGMIASFKLANLCPGVQLVSVSDYTATTLRAIFNVKSDAVIRNPLKSIYLKSPDDAPSDRHYITYVGRLVRAKNLHRLFPAIQDLLDETPGLRVCIIGEGEQRAELESMVVDDPRFEFRGSPSDLEVREYLRHTRIFVSGNEVEGFGITYLEAMSQGCIVAMPASGGGIEIAPDKVGTSVRLLPLSWDREHVLAVLRQALRSQWTPIDISPYTIDRVVASYLRVDSAFSRNGRRTAANATANVPALS